MFYQQSGELRYLQMVLRAKCMILSSLRNQFSQKSKLVLYCQTVYTWLLSVVWTSASIIKYHRIWMWLSSQNQAGGWTSWTSWRGLPCHFRVQWVPVGSSFCNCNQMFWCRPHGHMTWRHYWVVIRIRSVDAALSETRMMARFRDRSLTHRSVQTGARARDRVPIRSCGLVNVAGRVE